MDTIYGRLMAALLATPPKSATPAIAGPPPAVPVSRPVSVFVVPHRVRLGERFAGVARGRPVRLLRVEGETKAQVQAFGSALRPFLAAR